MCSASVVFALMVVVMKTLMLEEVLRCVVRCLCEFMECVESECLGHLGAEVSRITISGGIPNLFWT